MTEISNNNEEKFKSSKIRQRQRSRTMAVQALYSSAIGDVSIEEAMEAIVSSNVNSTTDSKCFDEEFFTELCKGSCENSQQLEDFIKNHLNENWKYERVDNLTKSILKVGLYEVFNAPVLGVNKSIAINEYIKISRSFNLEKDIGFINSVMDKMKERESLSETL